jgi:hypothetical protein
LYALSDIQSFRLVEAFLINFNSWSDNAQNVAHCDFKSTRLSRALDDINASNLA